MCYFAFSFLPDIRRIFAFNLLQAMIGDSSRSHSKDIEVDVRAHFDSSLMDCHNVGGCFPRVEISLLSQDDKECAIRIRKTSWTNLPGGERERWT